MDDDDDDDDNDNVCAVGLQHSSMLLKACFFNIKSDIYDIDIYAWLSTSSWFISIHS
jgi:hypothetical protein